MLITRNNIIRACVLVLLAGCSVSPVPLERDQIEQIARMDRDLIYQGQEELSGELTLEMAMALALKYNLESRVRLLEEMVANEQLDMTKLDLLPSLAANAGYVERDNDNASRSVSIQSGLESLEPSTSQDRSQNTANARFAWNLLDFGVSFLQAKQDADRYLVARKAREKIMLTLLKEVRAAYWKAVAMEEMRSDLDRISVDVDQLLADLEEVREQQLRRPIDVLTDIRALVETRQQLDELRRTIDTSSARLANLINARDFRSLRLPRADAFPPLVEMTDDIEGLELIALTNSADYASEIYNVRIDQLETRKTMLRLLPGLEFSYSENYHDNSFLLNHSWGELGLNLTGDISRLFFVKRLKKFRESSEELTIGRKLAINMAVITGVHITWQDYRNSLTQLERADYLQQIDEEIALLTRNAEVNSIETGAVAIQSDLKAFRSRIGQMQSYADAQQAYGEFMVSLGVNPIPEDYQRRSVEELAEHVASATESIIFPYTRQGELLAEERRKVDSWIEQRRRDSEIAEQRAAEAAEAEEEAERIRLEEELFARREVERQQAEAEEQERLLKAKRALEEERQESARAEAQRLAAEEAQARKRALDAPVEMVSGAPDMKQFLEQFWKRYNPAPELGDYLDNFMETLPGPDAPVKQVPQDPDREAYLEMFLEKLSEEGKPASTPSVIR